jgi:hypothetical protein
MITTIIILALAFTWLLYETKFLTIRLEYGALQSKSYSVIDTINSKALEDIICHKHGDNWKCHELPERTIKAFGHTMHFEAGCNKCRAKLLREVYRTQTSKAMIPEYKRQSSLSYTVLMADYERLYNEPKIDISVNGATLSVNGNYKRGMIKAFVKAN